MSACPQPCHQPSTPHLVNHPTSHPGRCKAQKDFAVTVSLHATDAQPSPRRRIAHHTLCPSHTCCCNAMQRQPPRSGCSRGHVCQTTANALMILSSLFASYAGFVAQQTVVCQGQHCAAVCNQKTSRHCRLGCVHVCLQQEQKCDSWSGASPLAGVYTVQYKDAEAIQQAVKGVSCGQGHIEGSCAHHAPQKSSRHMITKDPSISNSRDRNA